MKVKALGMEYGKGDLDFWVVNPEVDGKETKEITILDNGPVIVAIVEQYNKRTHVFILNNCRSYSYDPVDS